MLQPDVRNAIGAHNATEAMLAAALDRALEARSDIVAVDGTGLPPIRGDVVRKLLITASGAAERCITRFVLLNAKILGWLSIAGLELKLTPGCVGCHFDAGLNVTDAKVIGLELIGCKVPVIRADRLSASGSVLICKTSVVEPNYDGEKPDTGRASIVGSLLLSGAKIHGNLDLRGCLLGRPGVMGPQAFCVLADGVTVEGNLLLSDGLRSSGEIRLNGCEILRNFDCRGAVMTNEHGFTLSAAGGHVHGTIYLTRQREQDFTSTGTFRLDGARVDGDVNAASGQFTATAFAVPREAGVRPQRDDLDAFSAQGLTVGAGVRLCEGFRATGVVNLISARIGADLSCAGACFNFPGEEALYADGISVSGATFLTDGASTNGLLRFIEATLSQGFFMSDAVFDRDGEFVDDLGDANVSASELKRNICGVYAARATFGGTFYFRGNRKTGPAGRLVWLSLPYASATTVEDDPASWSAVDRMDLRDCDYRMIVGITGAEAVGWRLQRLDRQYIDPFADRSRVGAALTAFFHASDPDLVTAREHFAPQPYLKLAQVVRAAGYEGAANQILIHLERNRNCFGGMSGALQFARWMLDLCLRYGYAPFWPVVFLAAWIAVSAACFQSDYDSGQLASTQSNLICGGGSLCSAKSAIGQQVYFDAWIYATDTLVPLVDLNQRKNFIFSHSSWLLVFNSFFGWTMTSFFAAGVSGLARRSGS